jgi:hypothetical protein
MFKSFRGTLISQDGLDPGMRSASGGLSVEAVEGMSIASLICMSASRPAIVQRNADFGPYTRAGDVDSAASAGIVDALIRAEAMRTLILLIGGLQKASCYEENYISAGLASIARGLFRIRL